MTECPVCKGTLTMEHVVIASCPKTDKKLCIPHLEELSIRLEAE